jgi:UDPglucose 6-dehydrogenase
MKLTIIGTGYVGLVAGTGFATLGNEVICFDIDRAKIDLLAEGIMPIYEPGLEEIYKRNLKAGRLEFTTEGKKAVQESDIIFICVDTPIKEHQEADLTAVIEVAKTIGQYMNDYKIIVNKSTVPVGTADLVKIIIKENQQKKIEFDVVSNPEFLREGAAVKDFENPDRIVIGSDSLKAEQIMTSLYRSRVRADRPIITTSIRTAEIIKYASNAMLATRISFMNQLSYLCEKTDADIKAVARGMGLDNRIGSRFLQAGVGYGGSCFPKDIKALISMLKQYDCDSDLFEAVNRINEKQKSVVVTKLKSLIEVKNSTVAVWGISFKPKTDDIREAPSTTIIKELQKMGAKIHACDPVAISNAKNVLSDVKFFENPYETIRGCDALIIVTEWNEFRNLDMQEVKNLLKNPIIIDGRNIFDPQDMKDLGFKYLGIGR